MNPMFHLVYTLDYLLDLYAQMLFAVKFRFALLQYINYMLCLRKDLHKNTFLERMV